MAAGAAPTWRSWRVIPLVALGSALTLLLAGVIAGLYGERLYQAQKTREVGVQADILATTVSAAVLFHDTQAAQEYVNALRANHEIEAAGDNDEAGALLAGYQRSGSA